MKNYFDEDIFTTPKWMPVYISIMLVLLTLFIYLTKFVETDRTKIRFFKEEFKKAISLAGKGGQGASSITDVGPGDNPLSALINRMKSKGIDKKLMDEFLTLTQVKEMVVVEGERGVSITLPETVGFESGTNRLTQKAMDYLSSLVYLASELPYAVEIKGYTTGKLPPGYTDALEFSAKRANLVYNFFIDKGIAPLKLRLSGCGDAFEGSAAPQDKVEILFKSPEL